MINILKTVGYRTYSDGVGATNLIQSNTKQMQIAARMTPRSLNISHRLPRFSGTKQIRFHLPLALDINNES